MQKALQVYGYLNTAADGVFGEATEAAVKGFQNEKDTTITGRLDSIALSLLEIWAGEITDNSDITPSLDKIRKGMVYLKSSHSGSVVNTVSSLLIAKGYFCSSTDSYDTALISVAKQFQSANGLSADGNTGQGTLAVLEDTNNDWLTSGTVKLTAGKLAKAGFQDILLRSDVVTSLNTNLNEFGINTKVKVKHVLAQCMAETQSGMFMTESE